MATSRLVDVAPEYVAGIVNYLNPEERPRRHAAVDRRRRQLTRRGQALLDEAGITLLDHSAGDRHQRLLGHQDYSEPKASPSSPTSRAERRPWPPRPTARAGLDCERRPRRHLRHRRHPSLPLGYASDQTYQSVIDGESQLGQTSTTDGTLEYQGLLLLEDDKDIQPAQNLVPAVSPSSSPTTPTSPTRSTR